MIKTITILLFLLPGIASAEDGKMIIPFTAYGTFQNKETETQKKDKCLAGFKNHIDLAFHSNYRLIGKKQNLKISRSAASQSVKILESGEIQYEKKSGICSSVLQMEVPKSDLYSLSGPRKKEGFHNDDTFIYHYNMNIDQENAYLSFLSCIMPKEVFSSLLDAASPENADSPFLSLSYPAGTAFSLCEWKKKECRCTAAFHKKGLKKEIISKLEKKQ